MIDWFLSSLLIDSILKLSEQGGDIIFILALLAMVLWLFIFERFISLYVLHAKQRSYLFNRWFQHPNIAPESSSKSLWQQEQLVIGFLSDIDSQTARYLSLIKTCISLCPLLGLLGTVAGMITVFEVIAMTGTSDAKAMAGGIFNATLPTMTGLFLAVTALYFHYLLTNKASSLLLEARELCHAC